MAKCVIAFYSAYINLVVYGLIAGYALFKNWEIYGCVIMFLIIAPLVSIFLTAYMVTYLWYEQGRQITCIAFGSQTELLSQDIENTLLFIVQSTFVFTMYKIIQRITAPTKEEGLIRTKRVNRLLAAFLFCFFLETSSLLLLKSFIFRHPNQDAKSSYSKIEKSFLAVSALRFIFTGVLIYVFINVINQYIPNVIGKASKGHVCRVKFFKYLFPILFGLGSLYSHMILPYYYLQFLRNETADLSNPFGSKAVPPTTAIFNEMFFSTLPMMAWTIYQAVGNRHIVSKKKKKRTTPSIRRSNSMDSRRTTRTTAPNNDLIILEAYESH